MAPLRSSPEGIGNSLIESEGDSVKESSRKNQPTLKDKAAKETFEWIKAFGYAVIAVLIIRLFVFETMMVPTGSMIPAIVPGDRLFVERITFQAREPDYGEIVVFWTPFIDQQASEMLGPFDRFMDFFSPAEFRGHVKYVKRLVGKPGDILEMIPNGVGTGYHLSINGVIPNRLEEIVYQIDGIFTDPSYYKKMAYPSSFRLRDSEQNFFMYYNRVLDYATYYKRYLDDIPVEEYAWTNSDTLRVQVRIPEGFYFFVGDNSPASLDSRFFGFVPVENVVGGPLLRFWPFPRFGTLHQ